jgi:hypothetical protein
VVLGSLTGSWGPRRSGDDVGALSVAVPGVDTPPGSGLASGSSLVSARAVVAEREVAPVAGAATATRAMKEAPMGRRPAAHRPGLWIVEKPGARTRPRALKDLRPQQDAQRSSI